MILDNPFFKIVSKYFSELNPGELLLDVLPSEYFKYSIGVLNSLKIEHINNLSDVIIEFIKGLTAEKIEKFGFKG